MSTFPPEIITWEDPCLSPCLLPLLLQVENGNTKFSITPRQEQQQK